MCAHFCKAWTCIKIITNRRFLNDDVVLYFLTTYFLIRRKFRRILDPTFSSSSFSSPYFLLLLLLLRLPNHSIFSLFFFSICTIFFFHVFPIVLIKRHKWKRTQLGDFHGSLHWSLLAFALEPNKLHCTLSGVRSEANYCSNPLEVFSLTQFVLHTSTYFT